MERGKEGERRRKGEREGKRDEKREVGEGGRKVYNPSQRLLSVMESVLLTIAQESPNKLTQH